jgi:hypothetical protein
MQDLRPVVSTAGWYSPSPLTKEDHQETITEVKELKELENNKKAVD